MGQTIPALNTLAAELRSYPSIAAAVIRDNATDAEARIAALEGSGGALDFKNSVLVASTANLTLSGTQTIDGVAVTAGKRVLAKNQTTASENGIYVCAAGAWSRATDADSDAEVTPNMAVMVEQGSVNQDKIFYIDVNGPITLGSTSLTFNDFRGIAITAPADVTKATAAVGTSTTLARSDHKHDVSTAATGGLTSASTSTEGSATSLARSDHTHALTALNIASAGTVTAKGAGALAATDFGIQHTLVLTIPAGATADVDFTGAPFAFRVLDVHAQKVTTSADAGDTGALQTGAGSAISSTLSLNVSASAIVRTTSVVIATQDIAAAGTLRWHRVQSTNADCVVYVRVARVP